MDEPRIYVACLASYNAGKLHGTWIDLDGLDASDIQDEIDDMLENSPEPGAVEYAIHDHEGLPDSVRENTQVGEIVAILEFYALCEDRELSLSDARCVLDFYSDVVCATEAVNEHFCGVYDSREAYAADLEDLELGKLACYFDYEAYARDLFINDMSGVTLPRGIAVFYNH
jgi:antirestriction protein